MSIVSDKTNHPSRKAASTNQKTNISKSPNAKDPASRSTRETTETLPATVVISKKAREKAFKAADHPNLTEAQKKTVESIAVAADEERIPNHYK